jgi:glycosyltransferase involved in cell wall biosynthesis
MDINSNLVVIVPCFNEEQRFSADYFERLAKLEVIELIFVDDASTDNTLEILNSFSARHKNVKAFSLQNNLGKAECIRHGLLEVVNPDASGFMYLDADCEVPIGEVIRQIRIFFDSSNRNFNIFAANRFARSRRNIERTRYRLLVSYVVRLVVRASLRSLPLDPQMGLKIFRNNESFKNAITQPFRTRWFIDIELFLRLNHLIKLEVRNEDLAEYAEIPSSNFGLSQSPKIVKELTVVLGQIYRSKFKSN